jgi:predicted nuclease of restriction endonuclease-like RecB superfamily
LISGTAAEHGVDVSDVEDALFADLKSAQKLCRVGVGGSDQLVSEYQLSQLQAILLRAVSVEATVRCSSPLAYRALFKKLKFRRLLYTIQRSDDGYVVKLDGPFSLFESVTKYGLQLALVLPALMECDDLQLEAKLRWGKTRKPLTFRFSHRGAAGVVGEPTLPDEVLRLKGLIEEKKSDFRVQIAGELLDQPGVGVCVPDLKFEHQKTGEAVYLEVLGFWSRDAVWRRVELAERGLGARVLFAVSSRLRVSEDVLEGQDHAALYVYKGVMSPAQVLKKVSALARA